jgi:hypothetical protein
MLITAPSSSGCQITSWAKRLLVDYVIRNPERCASATRLNYGKGCFVATPFGQRGWASIDQHLTRRVPLWDALRAELPGLVPYYLRHGYALRAHQRGSMPRAAA